jgi:hypothetical protein
VTILIDKPGSSKIAKKVIESSRENYAKRYTPRTELEGAQITKTQRSVRVETKNAKELMPGDLALPS